LLFDLMTREEEKLDDLTAELRFNINFLAERLYGATEFLLGRAATKKLKLGYFGASTGAAAALVSAARYGGKIKAVVSRGGRPDLAGGALDRVQSPTLLIVGGNDQEVIELNRSALEKIKALKDMAIVPGATHLFEEPGTLKIVSELAVGWFKKYLS
jgi:pimeloyl-ACP methyl ester carboxylesterase